MFVILLNTANFLQGKTRTFLPISNWSKDELMRIGIAIVAALLGSCAAPPPDAGPRQARELVGRVAGSPQRCVLIDRMSNLRISDGDPHTLVYGNGRTVWSNDLGPSCEFGANDL